MPAESPPPPSPSNKTASPTATDSNPHESKASNVTDLPFEKAMAELEQIVQRLEAGRVDLEESITLYERGESLKKHCENLLKKAEARIEAITTDAEGQPTGTQPLDPDLPV